jgi:hypothetical protein
MVKSRQNEKAINIKLVQPIPHASSSSQPFAATDARDEKRKEKVEDIAFEIHEYLQDGKVSLSSLARHLKQQLGSDAEYRAMLAKIGQGSQLGALATLLRLFPDTFELLPSESNKPNFYVQRRD